MPQKNQVYSSHKEQDCTGRQVKTRTNICAPPTYTHICWTPSVMIVSSIIKCRRYQMVKVYSMQLWRHFKVAGEDKMPLILLLFSRWSGFLHPPISIARVPFWRLNHSWHIHGGLVAHPVWITLNSPLLQRVKLCTALYTHCPLICSIFSKQRVKMNCLSRIWMSLYDVSQWEAMFEAARKKIYWDGSEAMVK